MAHGIKLEVFFWKYALKLSILIKKWLGKQIVNVEANGIFVIGYRLLKPTGHVMHHQFNIQQLYALPTQYLCVLYLSGNKQRLVPLTA